MADDSPRRSYAVLGTGAVGGLYGGLLALHGHSVRFLVHSDYDHVRRHGLSVETPLGSFHLPRVDAYASAGDMPPSDVALVAIKSTRNDLLPRLLPPVLKPDGIAVVLQNGLGVDEEAARVVGPDRVLGGLCFLCSNKVGPGTIRHLDYGLITMGEFRSDGAPGGITARLREVANDFTASKIPVRLIEDLVLARWQKLVWNIPFNGLSVVMDATTAELMAQPATAALARKLMEEVAESAAMLGRPIEQQFVDRLYADTAKMRPYKTSMKLDYERGEPLERQAIVERPLAMARSAGAKIPHWEMLAAQLAFLDERRTRTPAGGQKNS